MSDIVFYSWQSDLPTATNWGFIENALERAAKRIQTDQTIEVEPVIDRDTAGIPGAPDIASVILAKIDRAQVFVADVSIIHQGVGRPGPNPNVLIELGYALKALGWSRVIVVMNTAFGPVEALPFDLRTKRVITYSMTKEQADRAPERRDLEKRLERELRTIFTEIEAQRRPTVLPAPNMADQAISSIEQQRPNQAAQVRQYMQHLVSQLDTLKPTFADGVPPDEPLLEALERTTDLVLEFVRVAEAVATMNAADAAQALYYGFEDLLEKYNLGNLGVGINNVFVGQFDFYKFIGHELFVTFFSLLIRERRWALIADLLEDELHLDNTPSGYAGPVSFEYVSRKIVLLDYRKERLQSNRTSLHADVLNDRHTNGELGTSIPMDRFAEADYFLFLRSILLHSEESKIIGWDAWSCVFIERQAPRYLVEASQRKYAQELLRPLGVPDIETLRSRLPGRAGRVAHIFGPGSRVNPVAHFDIQGIGSR